MQIKVRLNGTAVNPYHRMGFKQNPFPQIAKKEFDEPMRILNKLAADPIADVDQIEKELKGFSREFIDLCKARFIPGQMVEFTVEWPDDDAADYNSSPEFD